jgi:hypothetical protein
MTFEEILDRFLRGIHASWLEKPILGYATKKLRADVSEQSAAITPPCRCGKSASTDPSQSRNRGLSRAKVGAVSGGLKMLARRYYPDVVGSSEKMREADLVGQWLRQRKEA